MMYDGVVSVEVRDMRHIDSATIFGILSESDSVCWHSLGESAKRLK